MIIELRQYFKSQAFKVLLWAILISMSIGFLFIRQDKSARSTLFSINGTNIGFDAFEQERYKQAEYIQRMKERFGPLMDKMPVTDPSQLATQALIEGALLNQVAGKVGVALSPSYVAMQLNNPMFVVTHMNELNISPYVLNPDFTINFEKLQQILQFSGQTLASFEHQMESALQRSMVNNIVGLSAFVTQQEIKDAFVQEYVGKQYAYLKFPLKHFIDQQKASQPSDEALKSFFTHENKQTKRYWLPEKRAGIMYEFLPANYNLSIAQSDIKNYYNTYKSKKFLKEPAQIQIRRILFSLPDQATEEQVKEIEQKAHNVHAELTKNPEEFSQLAKKYSDDKQSASDGGLLPFFKRGDQNAALETEAFRLKHDGAFSKVITTDKGFEIIQRVTKKPVVYKPLETVKDDIIEQLKRQKFKIRFAENANRLIAKKDKKGIATFIEQKKGQESNLLLAAKGASKPIEKLFKIRKDSWTYFTDNDKGYLLKLTDIQKSSEPSFESVKERVLNDYSTKLAKKNLQKELDGAYKKASGVPLDDIAQSLQMSAKTTPYLKKNDNEKISKLVNAGIPVERMLSLQSQGASSTGYDQEGNGYLFKVVGLEPFNNELFEDKKSEVINDLYAEQAAVAERAFVASLARNATIKSKDPQFNIKG